MIKTVRAEEIFRENEIDAKLKKFQYRNNKTDCIQHHETGYKISFYALIGKRRRQTGLCTIENRISRFQSDFVPNDSFWMLENWPLHEWNEWTTISMSVQWCAHQLTLIEEHLSQLHPPVHRRFHSIFCSQFEDFSVCFHQLVVFAQ